MIVCGVEGHFAVEGKRQHAALRSRGDMGGRGEGEIQPD